MTNPATDDELPDLLSKLRVAIVHYWFVRYRGGERVLAVLADMFPQADIFTLVLDPKALPPSLRSRKFTTSFLQRIPGIKRHYKKFLFFESNETRFSHAFFRPHAERFDVSRFKAEMRAFINVKMLEFIKRRKPGVRRQNRQKADGERRCSRPGGLRFPKPMPRCFAPDIGGFYSDSWLLGSRG